MTNFQFHSTDIKEYNLLASQNIKAINSGNVSFEQIEFWTRWLWREEFDVICFVCRAENICFAILNLNMVIGKKIFHIPRGFAHVIKGTVQWSTKQKIVRKNII